MRRSPAMALSSNEAKKMGTSVYRVIFQEVCRRISPKNTSQCLLILIPILGGSTVIVRGRTRPALPSLKEYSQNTWRMGWDPEAVKARSERSSGRSTRSGAVYRRVLQLPSSGSSRFGNRRGEQWWGWRFWWYVQVWKVYKMITLSPAYGYK